jgi:hypothetical protein
MVSLSDGVHPRLRPFPALFPVPLRVYYAQYSVLTRSVVKSKERVSVAANRTAHQQQSYSLRIRRKFKVLFVKSLGCYHTLRPNCVANVT